MTIGMLEGVYEQPRLITPEAVRIHLEATSLGSRILAALIDAFLMGVLLTAVFTIAGLLGGLNDLLAVILPTVGIFLVRFGYPILYETMRNGKTPGKEALGLRVVTTQGAPIRFRHAAIRTLVGLFDFELTFGMAALISSLVSKDGRRLGDLAAGTLVIRTRQATTHTAAPVAFSPFAGTETFTTNLDVSRVDNEMSQTIRSFLLRIPELTPEARWSIGVKLATAAARRMNLNPPSGMHPETFLVSVMSATQQFNPPPSPPVWGAQLQQQPSSPAQTHAQSPAQTPTQPIEPPSHQDGDFAPPA